MSLHRVDIGWSAGNGFLDRLIQRVDGGKYNHVFYRFVFSDVDLLYESHLRGGVQITPWYQFYKATLTGKVTSCYLYNLDLTELQRHALWGCCKEIHGSGYDAKQIVFYYAWMRLWRKAKKHTDFLADWNDRDKFTCNEFIVATANEFCRELDEPLHPGLVGANTTDTPNELFKKIVESSGECAGREL